MVYLKRSKRFFGKAQKMSQTKTYNKIPYNLELLKLNPLQKSAHAVYRILQKD